MSIFAWIILGLVAGFIGSKIVNKRGEGLILDLILQIGDETIFDAVGRFIRGEVPSPR